jgi:hypothetical protein
MKKVKGIVAFVAAVMALNSATVVFAAGKLGDTTKGVGTFEGNVSNNVFKVVVPALTEDTSTLDFILDPNDLLEKTEYARIKAADSEATFDADAKGFYFQNSTGDYSYSGKSDKIIATNKSTRKVDVSIKAVVSGCSGVTFTDYNNTDAMDWTSVTAPTIYLALNNDADPDTNGGTVSTNDDYQNEITAARAPVTGATPTAELTGKIRGAKSDAFTLSYKDGEYAYSTKEIVPTGAFQSYTFWLEGQAGGKWDEIEDISPELDLIWSFDEYVGDNVPSVNYDDSTNKLALSRSTDTTITLNFGTGSKKATEVSAITLKSAGNDDQNLLNNTTFATLNDNKLTFKAALGSALSNSGASTGTIEITFNNDSDPAIAGDQPTTVVFGYTIS